MQFVSPPLVLHEDDDLLVINKPCSWNTHSPDPFAVQGVYDWLRNRHPRWSELAIIHRLDKETSGILVFALSARACRSLSQQFESRQVRKSYQFLTDHPTDFAHKIVESNLIRIGDHYAPAPKSELTSYAKTEFKVLETPDTNRWLWEARPSTGRTHQIRVQAKELGIPILGDIRYGGTESHRLHLHAASLTLQHPATNEETTFQCKPNFTESAPSQLRNGLIEPSITNAFRFLHGASDGCPGIYMDKLGDPILVEIDDTMSSISPEELGELIKSNGYPAAEIWLKRLDRSVGSMTPKAVAPKPVGGSNLNPVFQISENGIKYEIRMEEGYSIGLFLDQRDNRRRILTKHIAKGFSLDLMKPPGENWEVLNLFSYTCGFSVCAASAGANVTSIDLSRKYLEWGKRNFTLNDLDPKAHQFIAGDAIEWLQRFRKRGNLFDLVVVDPPTFSRSKVTGTFRALTDFPKLLNGVARLLKPGGVFLASSNAMSMTPDDLLKACKEGAWAAGRNITKSYFAPQCPDFPTNRDEPAHLKTFWVQLE